MRIGFLSDAHGNPFGLSVCLKQLSSEGAEQIYFLGDAAGYLPDGLAVMDELLRLEIPCIMGNHDAMVIGLLPIPEEKEKIYRLKSIISSMAPKIKKVIKDKWPVRRELTRNGKRIFLVHGRPSNPLEGYLYENGQFLPEESNNFDVVVIGHTHYPFIRKERNVLWLNVGSCGLPRDQGNLASCAIYDLETGESEIIRIPFDVEWIIEEYGNRIHSSVTDVLLRKSQNKIVGRIIGE